jgi:hypothetical protein
MTTPIMMPWDYGIMIFAGWVHVYPLVQLLVHTLKREQPGKSLEEMVGIQGAIGDAARKAIKRAFKWYQDPSIFVLLAMLIVAVPRLASGILHYKEWVTLWAPHDDLWIATFVLYIFGAMMMYLTFGIAMKNRYALAAFSSIVWLLSEVAVLTLYAYQDQWAAFGIYFVPIIFIVVLLIVNAAKAMSKVKNT